MTVPRNTSINGSIKCGHVFHGLVDFFVIKVGNLSQHCIKGTGGFADRDHLAHHRRENPAFKKRIGHCATFGNR